MTDNVKQGKEGHMIVSEELSFLNNDYVARRSIPALSPTGN